MTNFDATAVGNLYGVGGTIHNFNVEVLCSCPCLSVLQIINDVQLLALLNRVQEVERSKLKLLIIIIVFQKKKKVDGY